MLPFESLEILALAVLVGLERPLIDFGLVLLASGRLVLVGHHGGPLVVVAFFGLRILSLRGHGCFCLAGAELLLFFHVGCVLNPVRTDLQSVKLKNSSHGSVNVSLMIDGTYRRLCHVSGSN